MLRFLFGLLIACSMAATAAHAQTLTLNGAATGSSPGARHALLVVGHPGDEDHRTLYAELIPKLTGALTAKYGFAPEQVIIHYSDGTEESASVPEAQPGTRDEMAAGVARLREALQPEDSLWVIVIGHAHFDGRRAFLNLAGDDLTAEEFGRLFEKVAAREQVFFVTTALSGYFIKPLAAKGRVVIAATEADLELNETLFPQVLADVLAEPPADDVFDVNGDAMVSVFDLYIAVARGVAQRYLEEMSLQTEHAQLEDNGDGVPTELQLDYLTEEQGGRATEGSLPPPIIAGADGELAARVPLRP